MAAPSPQGSSLVASPEALLSTAQTEEQPEHLEAPCQLSTSSSSHPLSLQMSCPCAPASHEHVATLAEDDPRTLPHSRHVFLCYRQPQEWPASPFSFDWGMMPRFLRSAVQGVAETAPKKPLLTVCEGQDDGLKGCYNGDVLLFPDMLLYRGLTRFDIQCFVEEALMQSKCAPKKGRLQPESLTGCHVFVCCQSTYGSRCGLTGPRVASRLSVELAHRGLTEQMVRVWRCCHLAFDPPEAQCHGNVVVFGSLGKYGEGRDVELPVGGQWYNSVREEDIAELVETQVVGGRVLQRLWGGTMGKGEGGCKWRSLRLHVPCAKAECPENGDAAAQRCGELDLAHGQADAPGRGEAAVTAFELEMAAALLSSTVAARRRSGGPSLFSMAGPHQPNPSGPGPAAAPVRPPMQGEPLRGTQSCPEESARSGTNFLDNGSSASTGGRVAGPGPSSRRQQQSDGHSWGSPSSLLLSDLEAPMVQFSGHRVGVSGSPGRPLPSHPAQAGALAALGCCSGQPLSPIGRAASTELGGDQVLRKATVEAGVGASLFGGTGSHGNKTFSLWEGIVWKGWSGSTRCRGSGKDTVSEVLSTPSVFKMGCTVAGALCCVMLLALVRSGTTSSRP